MATGTDIITIHRELVARHRRLRWTEVGGRLHMAADALVRNVERMVRRVAMGQSRCQLADGSQQHVVLRRGPRRRARGGPRGAAIVVALGAKINAGIVAGRKDLRGSGGIIVG